MKFSPLIITSLSLASLSLVACAKLPGGLAMPGGGKAPAHGPSTDTGTTEHGATERSSTERGTTERGTTERGTTESGSTESGSTDHRAWAAIRDELADAVRAAESTSTPERAIEVHARLAALAERCRVEKLPARYEGAKEACADLSRPRPYAQQAADASLASVHQDLDKLETYKIPQAAKGEVWFDNDELGFLDAGAWIAARVTTLDELVARTGVVADTAAARARASTLAAAFDAALTGAARTDTAPRGMVTSKTITSTATSNIGKDGTVVRAGVAKDTIRKVKNDFGVVTGQAGTGFVVYQPPGKAYCFVRAFDASAEANGSNWQLWWTSARMVRVSRCK